MKYNNVDYSVCMGSENNLLPNPQLPDQRRKGQEGADRMEYEVWSVDEKLNLE